MAAIRQPEALTEGKLSYLAKADHIVSKKQYAHDAKNEAESIANTFTQVAYWMNFFTLSRAVGTLDDFTRDHLIWHRDGYLRDGYLQRIYGKIYPVETPHLPTEIGKEIVPKTFPQLKMHDDVSGREMLELTAAIDYEFTRGSDAYIDPAAFEEFINLHSMKTGECLGTQMRILTHLYCMAAYPATTLSTDPDLVPFFDPQLKPDENSAPGASKGFDQNSKFWKEYCKKEIFGQVQKKLTNVSFYSPELYAVFRDNFFEVKQQTNPTVTDQAAETKKLFFIKETTGTNANKQTIHKDLNPFVCLLALTMAIREKGTAMTQTASPMNMGSYKPYQTTAQTDLQINGATPAANLEIILNPYDWAKIKMGLRNTSPFGDYVVTLDDIESKGTTIYAVDTVLPGHAIIQDKNTYKLIKILYQSYMLDFDGCLANQRGAHLFLKTFISGFTAFCKIVPLAYIPPMECMYNNYLSFKIA